MTKRSIVLIALCAWGLRADESVAQTQDPATSISQLKKLSVEQLSDVQVTSVSRGAERLGGAAAAVTVVSNEDLRRSGATSVPDVLRLVPGIHVARQTANTWAISSRGFSAVTSEKLLVLSDTRSVYTPLFSGVFWDVQDHLLQDIDRIEVIRGPGATLWGSNAVNGVINITTKSAKETQGFYAETSAGTEDHVIAAARYGGRVGERTYYRVFESYSNRDASFLPPGPTSDDWRLGHIGARTDWESGDGDSLTIEGDLYRGDIGRIAPSVTVIGRPGPAGDLTVGVSGGNVLGRYRRRGSGDSEMELRVYYDQTHRDDPSFLDDLHTVDGEFQHRLAIGTRQDVTWGISDRFMANENHGKGLFVLDPSSSRDNIVAGFVQHQLAIRRRAHLTLGTKLEHNDFSGFEVQPSGRIAWELSNTQTIWGAISRAVRVPTRLERDVAIDITPPGSNPIGRLLGNTAFESEKLVAYEVGHRWRMPHSVFVDVAAFHNRYSGLSSLEIESPFVNTADGRIVVPIRNENLSDGRTTGAEVLGTVSPRQTWRLTATYAYVDVDITTHGMDANRGKFYDGATPRHQVGLRSFLDLPRSFQFDAQLRSLSAVRRLPPVPSGQGIPGYSEMDMRLAWHGWRRIELSLVGQNLLHDHHPEFGPAAQRGEIERAVYAKVTWGF